MCVCVCVCVCQVSSHRPAIKENTSHVVAARQNISLLWCAISVKLNIGKKMTGLEIMAPNHEKIYHVSKLIELTFKWRFHCLQRCFRNHTGREDA